MSSKTTKKAISDALSDLTKEKVQEFCSALVDRGGEPRVRRAAVQDKSVTEIAGVLVETFTEPAALEVTLELLKEIDCNKVAQDLAMVNPRAQVKSDLKSLQAKWRKYKEFEQKYKEVFQQNKKTAVATEKQIRADIEMLHQVLREEEEARLADLRQDEERKADAVRREMKNVQERISSLSDGIAAVERELQEPSGSCQRVQCPVPEPQLLSGAMIDVTRHLGNLSYRVWERMKEKVKFTPVILDPNTANRWLHLSEDLTGVRNTHIAEDHTTKGRQLPENPERFTDKFVVLGSEGFSSGKHSWEVEVGDHPYWRIGVAKETVDRIKPVYTPAHGYWFVCHEDGKYKRENGERIPVQRNLQRIRVQLDYARGEVSFYDPEDMTHLCTHEDIFTEKVYPCFLVGRCDAAETSSITVCHAEISHSVTIQ